MYRERQTALSLKRRTLVHDRALRGDTTASKLCGVEIPSHWLLERGSHKSEAIFASLYAAVAKQNEEPFIAASLVRATILGVLQRRDPSVDYNALLPPMPARLADLTGSPEDFRTELAQSAGPSRQPAYDTAGDDLIPEWRKALDSGALRPVESVSFWSPLFCVNQLERSRLIFDLRRFNDCFAEQPFAMESLVHVPLIASGARFAAKLDLSSAFWQYPVDDSLATFFGTSSPADRGRSKLYQWQCLPLGFTGSPILFSGLTAAFVQAWRASGVRVLA